MVTSEGESSKSSNETGGGLDNYGYTRSPPGHTSMVHSTSVDNLLDREKNNFLLKYRQVSGDLRGSQELVEAGEDAESYKDQFIRSRSLSMNHHTGAKSSRDRSIIESKTVRKEKGKSRYRDTSSERLYGSGLTPALRKVKLEKENNCYTNAGMDTSNEDDVFLTRAPLASQESDLSPMPRDNMATTRVMTRGNQECDLSPVPPPMSRNMYNASYRLATNHNLPRTSTKLHLDVPRHVQEPVRHVPQQPPGEPVYTVAGPGPIRRFTVPQNVPQYQTLPMNRQGRPQQQHVPPPMSSLDTARASHVAPLTRGNVARASMYSVATQDSGHYSHVSSVPRSPTPTAMFKLLTLLLPPCYRRKLQLLLKFIMKISLNQNLRLDSSVTNSSLALDTFLEVILRPSNLSRHNRELAMNIVQYFLDHYEQCLTPPQDLRRDVEEQVYRSLVSKRLEAGEDPYPVTYCEQVTTNHKLLA